MLPSSHIVRSCFGAGLIGLVLAAGTASAQTSSSNDSFATNVRVSTDGAWTTLESFDDAVLSGESWVRPRAYRALSLNVERMKEVLVGVPREPVGELVVNADAAYITLPMPDGTEATFAVWETFVLAPTLADQFPEIKTYLGQRVDGGPDCGADTLRMDLTPQGFHAQVLSPNGTWYIDPVTKDDTQHYVSFWRSAYVPKGNWVCHTEDGPVGGIGNDPGQITPGFGSRATGTSLRVFDLAISATGEYTAYNGGTQASGLAAVTTLVNRVTGIYEKDFSVRLQLVANNNLLIYTNAATDPFSAPNADNTTNTENQNNINTVIGTANYDIGHVVHRGGGGLAGGIGVVCGANKGKGISATDPPIGDLMAVDYLSHEIGHQFGGRHSFNNCNGGPGDAANIAHEPGSGSTIMGYAGICGTNDLQTFSDPMFGSIGYDQVTAYVASVTCFTSVATGNTPPTVTAPASFNIPARTPYQLTATGADANGDTLTYSWEQRNGGAAVAMTSFADNGSSPIARVFAPTTNPVRTLPRLSNLLAGTTAFGEILPTTTRTLNWRVVARDNRANGGGVEVADTTLNVTDTGAAFTVTAPNAAVSWNAGSTQTVIWNVAGTTAAPISAANVSILFSTDGGNTFPITILSSTPNDGTQSFVVPNNTTTNGRIMVKGANNVFFNINTGGAITVLPPLTGVSITGTGSNVVADSDYPGNNNGQAEPGESAIRLSVPLINQGGSNATAVSATLTSLTANVTVTSGTSAYPNLPSGGGTGTNSVPFRIAVGSAHPCGTAISLRLNVTSGQGNFVYNFTIPSGTAGGPGPAQPFAYTGAPVAIPDNNTTGASASVVVSGVTGTIADVNLRFDGSACSAAVASTTVGLDHTYLGDLVITLTSPQGTVVTLSNRSGVGGNNLCGTEFDDNSTSPFANVTAAGNPWTGTYSPATALSALNGQNANGTWTLKVVDAAAQDTGSIRAFRILISTNQGPTCTPPLGACINFGAAPSNLTRCEGENASFVANASSGSNALTYTWLKGGSPVVASPRISGLGTSTLSIANLVAADAGQYSCQISSVCGSGTTAAATLAVNVCGPVCNDLDFNNDGNIDPSDVDAYFSVLGEGPCTGGVTCDGLDFNNDGNIDPSDVDAYFSVLGEGPCL